LHRLGIEPTHGDRNATAWMFYMRLGNLPFVGYLAGPLYYRFWSHLEGRTPFYAALYRFRPGARPPTERLPYE
jgi:hypothetical protein